MVEDLIAWLRDVITYVAGWSSDPLETSPLLAVVWAWVLEQAGMKPNELRLNMGNFGAFLGAYPATIMWKLANDEEMFPGGVHAVPAEGLGDER